jgi:nitric oxide synthase-interacting protein
LNRESFLPFGSCQLCLLPARDPVACPTKAHLFCRECAVNNLLTQSKELKRLKRDAERRQREEEEGRQLDNAEADARALEEFEKVQTGLLLRSGGGSRTDQIVGRANGKIIVEEDAPDAPKGTKRKFELDEAELVRLADADREDAKRRIVEERSAKSALPSFWVPGETPANHVAVPKAIKRHPTCPAAAAADKPHDFSLKTLITVHFEEGDESKSSNGATSGDKTSNKDADTPTRTCPSCHKVLSNATKGMLAMPCGHVLCKACSDKFQRPQKSEILADHGEDDRERCFVCQEDITPSDAQKSKKKKRKDKRTEGADEDLVDTRQRGLVEICSDGTGFAGGGTNMVRKEGVAFQC